MQKPKYVHRLLALLVAAFMAVCCLPMAVFAQDTVKLHVEYQLIDGTYVSDETVDATLLDDEGKIDVSSLPLNIPRNYKPAESNDPDAYFYVDVNDPYFIYYVEKDEPTTEIIGINYWDVVNNVQVFEGSLTVVSGTDSINTSDLTDIPAGYELVTEGSVNVYGGWAYIEVKPLPTTETIGINYWDVVNNVQVFEGSLTVVSGTDSINTSDLTDIPAGYELVTEGSVNVYGGWAYIEVKPLPTTETIGINYWDVVNNVQVLEGSLTVVSGTDSINTSDLTDIPAGYELVTEGNVNVYDGWAYIEVKPVSDTVIMKIQFKDGDEVVAAGDFFVPAGVQNYSILKELGYVPEGYAMSVGGDFTAVDEGNLIVPIHKLSTEIIMNIRFMDGETFVAGGDYFLPAAGVQNYNILKELGYLPEGYVMSVGGDFTAVDEGELVVPVHKITTEIIMNIRFMDGETFVAGGDYFLPAAGVQNYNILKELGYLPTGYEMDVAGDFTAVADGELVVPVHKLSAEIIMNIRFMEGETFVAGGDYFLTEGVHNYSVLADKGYLPEGYEMDVAGDFMAKDGAKLTVPVHKTETSQPVDPEEPTTPSTPAPSNPTAPEQSSNNSNTTTVSSSDNDVVKPETPADNSSKIIPQTGLTIEQPMVLAVMMASAFIAAAAYLFIIRKKLN